MLDRALRVVLVVLNLFLAITAIIGGIWVIPTLPRAWLAGTPFSSFLIPALALALVVGGGALTAAFGLVFGRSWAPLVSMVTGAAIAIFEVVETVTLSLHFWLHTVGLESGPFTTALPIDLSGGIPIPMLLQPIYFVYGLMLVGLSAWLWLRHRRPIHDGPTNGSVAASALVSGCAVPPVDRELQAGSSGSRAPVPTAPAGNAPARHRAVPRRVV